MHTHIFIPTYYSTKPEKKKPKQLMSYTINLDYLKSFIFPLHAFSSFIPASLLPT